MTPLPWPSSVAGASHEPITYTTKTRIPLQLNVFVVKTYLLLLMDAASACKQSRASTYPTEFNQAPTVGTIVLSTLGLMSLSRELGCI